MKDANEYRQAICAARNSDRIIQFISADKFTEAAQALMENGDVYGAYFEKSGAIVLEDRDGRKHYNTLADGTGTRPQPRWIIALPMHGTEVGNYYGSKAAAKAEKEAVCDLYQVSYSAAVVLTVKQWNRYLDKCQHPEMTEELAKKLVSSIIGYDFF